MPKTSSTHGTREGNPHVLKRYQACHQCRKRKMKCDARRPCSCCVRSHAYATLHAGPDVTLPSKPDCTYDEAAEAMEEHDTTSDEDRYIALENRILELESKLRGRGPPDRHTMNPSEERQKGLPIEVFELPSIPVLPPPLTLNAPCPFTSFASIESIDRCGSSKESSHETPGTTLHQRRQSDEEQEVSPHSWPLDLPSPSVLRHLVEAFFTYHLHAHHLFHAPTFLESLSYPPSHINFPSTALLHALCAVGCQYTTPTLILSYIATHSPLIGTSNVSPDQRRKEFGSYQALLAKRRSEENHDEGQGLVQYLQMNILLVWFYWWQAKWIEAYTQAAMTLRIAVSMGLNKSPPFQNISEGVKPLSIIPPATDSIEKELRRNIFWLAYALERHFGCGNGWALSLDDQDVCELLPAPADNFVSGTPLDLDNRQWSLDHDILQKHPPNHTDSFLLYVKSTIFLSRVKNFNLRYRAKFYTMNVAEASLAGLTNVTSDPREALEFRELEEIADTFRDTFPSHLKHPMVDGSVDPYLFSAILAPYVARITLHEPYAMVGSASCWSASNILGASRAILDLIYMLTSSSFDTRKIGLFPVFAWFTAGRVLTRFLKGAQREKSEEQITSLEAEIAFVWAVLARLGEHVPLSSRYARMLRDHIANTCDTSTVEKVGLMADNANVAQGPNLGNEPELQESNRAEATLLLRLAKVANQPAHPCVDVGGNWYQRIDHPVS